MTLRKSEDTEIERSTRSHCVENALWKRLWTRRNTGYVVTTTTTTTMMMMMMMMKLDDNRRPP
jgi:hypothetical protein